MNGEQSIGEPDHGPDHGAADGPGFRASGGVPGVGAVPVVTAARAVFADAVDALASAAAQSVWALPDAESRELVRDLAEQLARIEAVFLAAVRDLDSRAEAVEGARAGFVAQTFLRVALHRSPRQAARDVAAARALDPSSAGPGTAGEDPFADGEVHAPALGAVLAAGMASREHIDLGVRALGELPKGLRRQVDPDGVSVGAKADAYLAEQAQLMDPHTFRQVCAQLRAYLDPDHQRFDAEAYERRFLHLRVGEDGMVLLRGQLPADQGAVVKAALDAASAPQPAVEVVDEHGQPALVRDDRTKGQRYADGLVGIARHWNGCDHDDARADTQVMVVADLDQLCAARAARATQGHAGPSSDEGDGRDVPGQGEAVAFTRPPGLGTGRAHCLQTGPIPALTLQALSCDAVLQSVLLDRSGAVLTLGRMVRTVSAAQRRALIARDRGCVLPGCHAPPGLCEAHHVRWWRHGGATDLENLALVCGRHHSEIHAGIWTLEMIDGVPYGIPPRWAHGGRPRLRNTVHHTDVLARHVATQLVIDLTEPVSEGGADPTGDPTGDPTTDRAATKEVAMPPDTG